MILKYSFICFRFSIHVEIIYYVSCVHKHCVRSPDEGSLKRLGEILAEKCSPYTKLMNFNENEVHVSTY